MQDLTEDQRPRVPTRQPPPAPSPPNRPGRSHKSLPYHAMTAVHGQIHGQATAATRRVGGHPDLPAGATKSARCRTERRLARFYVWLGLQLAIHAWFWTEITSSWRSIGCGADARRQRRRLVRGSLTTGWGRRRCDELWRGAMARTLAAWPPAPGSRDTPGPYRFSWRGRPAHSGCSQKRWRARGWRTGTAVVGLQTG